MEGYLAKLNAAATYLPTRKLKELAPGDYTLTGIRRVVTKYGNKVVAELNQECAVFLPVRVLELLAKDEAMFKEVEEAVRQRKLVMRRVEKKEGEFSFITI